VITQKTKIIRLQSGEDLIGTVTLIEDQVLISEPMVFQVDNRGGQSRVMMTFFLPEKLIEENEITISKDDVLFMVNPNEMFLEKYQEAMQQYFYEEDPATVMKELIVQAFLEMDPEEKIIH
jgi:hypothetical protein